MTPPSSKPDPTPPTDPFLAYYDLALTDAEPADEAAPVEDHDHTPQPSPEQPGGVIAGRYVLKTVLGEGGTGQVWAAEQTQPVRREVAIKITRPGLLSKPVSARFNREHQVLARMEHPNIAAVFDAGELPDGRTYFVMELVSGKAVTRWCGGARTPLREKLDIFVQACMAVHHAHQKGILHRDLKPSNVMVTQVDGKPVVKVIDFGIAKTLEGDLSLGQDVTLRGMVLGTPRYMSPEQAGLTGQQVDARTDVYALGVLLYELLTGTTPIPEGGGIDPPLPELLQRVRQTETEPPSRRALRALPAVPRLPSEAKTLARELRGELDWIIMRALAKARDQRYPTAQALAEDVQRFLRDEPVSAGPPGRSYRAKKWLVRHRLGLTTFAAVLLSLGGGLAAAWWAWEGESAQRQDALRMKQVALNESDLARQVSAQLEEMLENSRKHVEAGMNTQMLRNLADECAAGMARFATQPKTEARLAEQLAQLYEALEERGRALPWYERRWQLLKQTQGEQSRAALLAEYGVGWRFIERGEPQKAAVLLRHAAAGLEALPDATEQTRIDTLLARRELARALSRMGQHEEAMTLVTEVTKARGESDPVEAAIWLREQAVILRAGGRQKDAEAAVRRALDLLPQDAALASQRAYLQATLAGVGEDSGRYDLALQASGAQVALLEETLSSGHPRLINALMENARLACKVPDCPGGEEAARRALDMAQTAGHESLLAEAWITLSETLRMKRQYRESEQVLRDAIEEVGKTRAERWRLMELHRRLGDILTSRRDYEEALEHYETAAAEWFPPIITGRPPEKERLIFTSFIKFWELAAEAGSPVADESRLTVWKNKLEAWRKARAAPAPAAVTQPAPIPAVQPAGG